MIMHMVVLTRVVLIFVVMQTGSTFLACRGNTSAFVPIPAKPTLPLAIYQLVADFQMVLDHFNIAGFFAVEHYWVQFDMAA